MIHQCNFQSGQHPGKKAYKDKKYKEKETSLMTNIMTPVHVVRQNNNYYITYSSYIRLLF